MEGKSAFTPPYPLYELGHMSASMLRRGLKADAKLDQNKAAALNLSRTDFESRELAEKVRQYQIFSTLVCYECASRSPTDRSPIGIMALIHGREKEIVLTETKGVIRWGDENGEKVKKATIPQMWNKLESGRTVKLNKLIEEDLAKPDITIFAGHSFNYQGTTTVDWNGVTAATVGIHKQMYATTVVQGRDNAISSKQSRSITAAALQTVEYGIQIMGLTGDKLYNYFLLRMKEVDPTSALANTQFGVVILYSHHGKQKQFSVGLNGWAVQTTFDKETGTPILHGPALPSLPTVGWTLVDSEIAADKSPQKLTPAETTIPSGESISFSVHKLTAFAHASSRK